MVSEPPQQLHVLAQLYEPQASPAAGALTSPAPGALTSPAAGALASYMTPAPSTPRSMSARLADNTDNISAYVKQLRAQPDVTAAVRQAELWRAEIGRHADQCGAELKQLLKTTASYEEQPEYKRLIAQQSRLTRSQAVLGDFIERAQQQLSRQQQLDSEPDSMPHYVAPKPPPQLQPPPAPQQRAMLQSDSNIMFDFEEAAAFPFAGQHGDTGAMAAAGVHTAAGASAGADAEGAGGGGGDMWECEHCTMHNPVDTRICQVCDKTSRAPKRIHSISSRPVLRVTSAPGRMMPASNAMTSPGPSTSGVTPLRSKDPLTGETPTFHTQSIAEEQDEIFILKVRIMSRNHVLRDIL